MSGDMKVKFFPSGRGKAQNPPDPEFPKGVHIRAPAGVTHTCRVELPYPAPECGMFSIACERCGLTVMITAAGRVDDPVSVELPCAWTAGRKG
jgi:hypothetical protein